MSNRIIGYRLFVDGLRRPIYEDAQGQCVLNDECERVYGLYILQEEEESCDPSVMVDEHPSAILR
jgi:hypothetical protein